MRCKATGTVWAPGAVEIGPIVDTTNTYLKNRCLDFSYSNGAVNKNLFGPAIPLQTAAGGPMTIFMASYFQSNSVWAVLALQHGSSSTAIQSASAAPAVFRFRSNNIFAQQISSTGTAYSEAPVSVDATICTFIIPDMTPANTVLRSNLQDVTESFSTGQYFSGAWVPNYLGSTDSLYRSSGRFGEMIVYNRVLNSAEISAVEQYLDAKWIH